MALNNGYQGTPGGYYYPGYQTGYGTSPLYGGVRQDTMPVNQPVNMPAGQFSPMQGQAQPNPMQYAQQTEPVPEQERIWVQGEVGMKAYLVANGSSVVLWDSERPIVYIKSRSMDGMPHVEYLAYENVTAMYEKPMNAQPMQSSPFVTRDEFNHQMDEIRRMLSVGQASAMGQSVSGQEDSHAE